MTKNKENEDLEDLKSLQAFAERFQLFKSKEDEQIVAKEYYDLRHNLVPMAISYNFPAFVLNYLVHRYFILEDELVNRNWRLILRIAKSQTYANKGLPLYDRAIHGYMGFKYGLKIKYNPYSGNKVGTYCTWWVHQHIQRAIGKFGGAIKIAGNVQDIMSKINVVTQEWVADPNRIGKPTAEQICDQIIKKYPKVKGITPEKVAEYGRLKWDFVSLNEPTSNEDSSLSLVDYIRAPESYQPEESYQDVERTEKINELLRGLSEKERQVITHRFGLIDCRQKSVKEVAKLMSIKQAEVKELEESALVKLKQTATLETFY